MRRVTFLRGSLILPVIVPISALVLSLFGISGALTKFIVYASLVGAIPYAITVGILLFVSYKAEVKRFLYWWGFAPFLMAAVVGPVLVVVFSINGAWSGDAMVHAAASWGILVLYCLLVGYAYIALAYLLYLALKALRLVRTEPRPLDAILAAASHDGPKVA